MTFDSGFGYEAISGDDTFSEWYFGIEFWLDSDVIERDEFWSQLFQFAGYRKFDVWYLHSFGLILNG